jgi:hypothetical protein
VRVQLADRDIVEWLLGQCDDDFLIGKTFLLGRSGLIDIASCLNPLGSIRWKKLNGSWPIPR